MNIISSLEKRAASLEATGNIRDQYKAAGLREALTKYADMQGIYKHLGKLRSEAGNMCYNWEDPWNDDRRKLYDNNKQDTARFESSLKVLEAEFERAL